MAILPSVGALWNLILASSASGRLSQKGEPTMISPSRSAICLFGALALVGLASQVGAGKAPLKKLTYDPKAETINLHDGVDEELLEARMVCKNEKDINVFIENKSDKPLTVQMPEAIVGVQVFKQFQPPGGGGNQGGFGQGGNQGGGGQAQSVGGGQGNQGLQGGGQQPFNVAPEKLEANAKKPAKLQDGSKQVFTVPAGRTVMFNITGVCLEHGKRTPTSGMKYKIIRVEEYTENVELQELLRMFNSRSMSQSAVQAAAWHIGNGMSWEELANKHTKHLGGIAPTPYFNPADIQQGMSIATTAAAQAKEREKEEKEENPRLKKL